MWKLTIEDDEQKQTSLPLVHEVDTKRSDRGEAVIAFDAVDAGIGDRVLIVTEGFSAMTSVGRPASPIDLAVLALVDHI